MPATCPESAPSTPAPHPRHLDRHVPSARPASPSSVPVCPTLGTLSAMSVDRRYGGLAGMSRLALMRSSMPSLPSSFSLASTWVDLRLQWQEKGADAAEAAAAAAVAASTGREQGAMVRWHAARAEARWDCEDPRASEPPRARTCPLVPCRPPTHVRRGVAHTHTPSLALRGAHSTHCHDSDRSVRVHAGPPPLTL